MGKQQFFSGSPYMKKREQHFQMLATKGTSIAGEKNTSQHRNN